MRLTFERPVAEFATLMKEDCAFEFVRCLALVEAGLAAPAQCRARVPLDHEKRSLDAAEFPKSLGQLAWFAKIEPDSPDTRLNEGVVAPDGSFWVRNHGKQYRRQLCRLSFTS